jgi:RNA polymerase sigma-70 factor, ECF subfamily
VACRPAGITVPPIGSARDELDRIAAARADPQAFAPLYEAYADLVWRYALRRLGDPDRAADVTSATFVQAIRALPGFQPEVRGEETTFRSWLMTIARNAVISEWRRRQPAFRLDGLDAGDILADTSPSPEEHAIRRDERDDVLAALAQLPPVQRRIVELRVAGLKSAEIADLLDMRVSAVNTAHFRAIARLRDLLGAPVAPQGKGTSA